jgi:hypothetical protein
MNQSEISNNIVDGFYGQAGTMTISGNTFSGNGNYGILNSASSTFRHNRIINNTNYGVYITGGSSNLGSNSISDKGNNSFLDNDNGNIQVYNSTVNTIAAHYNYWYYTDSTIIDLHIYDDDENGSYGPINFDPWLTSDPHLNDPPVLSAVPALDWPEDDSLIYEISNWYPFVYDPDHDDSLLTYNVLSTGNVNAIRQDSVFIFAGNANWFGNDSLQLIVSDLQYSDTTYIHINVNPINDPPAVSLPDSVVFDADTSKSINLWDYINDIETPDSLLTKQFYRTNDSLLYDYNNVSGFLTFSADTGFSGIVYFNVTVLDDSGAYDEDTLIVKVIEVISNIDELISNPIPKIYSLSQNYPNPFNPITLIRYGLPKPTHVKLEIYNIIGQKVATIEDAYKKAGFHKVKVNSDQLATGTYLYMIQAGEFKMVKKMVVMK